MIFCPYNLSKVLPTQAPTEPTKQPNIWNRCYVNHAITQPKRLGTRTGLCRAPNEGYFQLGRRGFRESELVSLKVGYVVFLRLPFSFRLVLFCWVCVVAENTVD